MQDLVSENGLMWTGHRETDPALRRFRVEYMRRPRRYNAADRSEPSEHLHHRRTLRGRLTEMDEDLRHRHLQEAVPEMLRADFRLPM